MAKKNVYPSRQISPDFSKTPLTGRLGPKPVDLPPLEAAINAQNQDVEYNDWQVMDVFDEGLRQALINWINTTKEGVVVTNPTGSTRSKTINFQFYGNPSKDIIGAGEVGKFELKFQYTRRIVQPISTSSGDNNLLTR
jgi:hypothetical protein